MQIVVIGTHPTVDTSIAVGPFRSYDAAGRAWDELTAKGYIAETVQLVKLDDLEPLTGFEDGD